jgi:hypothetical protein
MHRFVHKHEEGTIDDYHEWYITGKTLFLGKDGRRSGSRYAWLVLECNNPGCKGKAIMRIDEILSAIPLGKIGKKR